MNKQISLLTAALLLIQVPAWSGDMADHSGHDMAAMQADDAKKDGMSDMDHSQMKGMDHSQMKGMDHSQMKGMDHSQMKGMDHSQMKGMDHSQMKGMDQCQMKGMDHSQMKGMDQCQMKGMDHSQMKGMDQCQMKGMDHSQMKGMDQCQMKGMDHSQMKGMDHSQMKGMDHSQMKGMDHSQMKGMDHCQMKGMDHCQMKDMDHCQMKGMTPSDPSSNPGKMPGMSSESMPSSDGGEMQMAPMQGGSAPPGARDANAYSDGYEPSAHSHMGEENFGALLVEKLEAVRTGDKPSTSYDVKAWYGRDYDRVVLKAEGEIEKGKLVNARTEILWGHAIATYWDTQLGIRQDSGVGPNRSWLAFGVEGLAPYWFDLEATAYVGSESRTALRFAASYDILLTQKLVLNPQIEANLYGKDDPKREIGSGLSSITTGLRLRYEINRQFAPYIGVEWKNMFGGTADYARLAGEKSNESSVVAGLQFWF